MTERFTVIDIDARAIEPKDLLARSQLVVERTALIGEKVHVWVEGRDKYAEPWRIYDLGARVTVARSVPPVTLESREVGPMSVDIRGPWDAPVFEIGRWDNDEGAFVHVASLSREEADALHTALGRTLLG